MPAHDASSLANSSLSQEEPPSPPSKPVKAGPRLLQRILSIGPNISGGDSKFLCIGCKSDGKRCGNPIKKTQNAACNAWRYISTLLPENPALTRFLEEYAKLCTCHHHQHQADPEEVEEWINQLKKFYSQRKASSPILHLERYSLDISGDSATLPQSTPGTFPVSNEDLDRSRASFDSEYTRALQTLCWHDRPQAEQDEWYAPSPPKSSHASPQYGRAGQRTSMKLFTRSTELQFRTLVESPIGKEEVDRGFIYIYTSQNHPDFVKIGYTKSSPDSRTDEWERQCHRATTLEYPDPFDRPDSPVSCVRRVERLIHTDLESRGLRHRQACQCGSIHNEWFSLGLDEAKEVVAYWESWMRDFNPYGIGYRINENGLLQPTGRGLLREEFLPHLVIYDRRTIPVDIRDFYCGYDGLPWVNICIRGTGKSEDRNEEDSNGDIGSTPSKPPGTSRRVSGKTARKASGRCPAAADEVALTSLEQVHGVDSSPVLQTPEPDSGPNAGSAPVSRSEGSATPSRLDGSVPNTPESPMDGTAELPSSTQGSFYSLPGEDLTEHDLATITDLAASEPAAVQLQQAVVASSVVLTAASAAAAVLEQQRLPAYKSETTIRPKPDPVMETLA